MAFEQFGKEHMNLTKVIEKYFGADAGHLDISCLDLARQILEAGYDRPVRCKDCKYYTSALDNGEKDCSVSRGLVFAKPDDFCSIGKRMG